jgi:hypothetical protein
MRSRFEAAAARVGNHVVWVRFALWVLGILFIASALVAMAVGAGITSIACAVLAMACFGAVRSA